MAGVLRSGIRCIAALALSCGGAGAIQVCEVGGTGTSGPVAVEWTVYAGVNAVPDGTTVRDRTGASGTDWEVLLGVKEFGAPEGGEQVQGLYGAGVELDPAVGYRVAFNFDGYTWDAYSMADDSGIARGYWDLFAVNLNQRDFYWNLVAPSDEEVTPLWDPLVTPDPSGKPVVSTDPLPGVTWGWGGADWEPEGFEQQHGFFWIELTGDASLSYFLSVILDTNTPDSADSAYPSWGGFDASGDVPRPTVTPEPGTLALLGTGCAALLEGWRRRRVTARGADARR